MGVRARGGRVPRANSSASSDRNHSARGSQRLPSTRVLARFLAQAQAAVRLRGHVSVLLTTNAAIRKLNRQFRRIDKSTDVLSFPVEAHIQKQEKVAGDLAISVPTARRQAAAQGHSLATEIKVLILHGLLHLAGYDHESDAGQMARRERTLRARLGLPQGLIERAENLSMNRRVTRRIGPIAGGAGPARKSGNIGPTAGGIGRTAGAAGAA
ncbi:MAG: rRNA maturation RNase YbeY [Terracidiphilus sp.]